MKLQPAVTSPLTAHKQLEQGNDNLAAVSTCVIKTNFPPREILSSSTSTRFENSLVLVHNNEQYLINLSTLKLFKFE